MDTDIDLIEKEIRPKKKLSKKEEYNNYFNYFLFNINNNNNINYIIKNKRRRKK